MPELQGMPTLRSPSQTMSMTFAEYWTVEWNFLSSNLTHFLSVVGCCQFCCKEDYILTDEGLHAVSCLSPPQSHSMGTNPFDPQLVGRHQQSRTWNNMEDFLVSPTWGDFGEKFQSCDRMGNWEHSMITGNMETLGTQWKYMNQILSCIIYWLYIHIIYIYINVQYTYFEIIEIQWTTISTSFAIFTNWVMERIPFWMWRRHQNQFHWLRSFTRVTIYRLLRTCVSG